MSFGLLWFAAALSPATGIAFPINEMMAERWMYMPLMGLFLGVTQTAAVLFEKRQYAARALVLVLVVALGTATFLQNKKWLNPETFYQNVVQNGGNPLRVTYILGIYYLEQREFDKAIALSRHEIDNTNGRWAGRWISPHMLQAMAWLQVQPDQDGMVSSVDDMARFVRTSPHIPEAIAEFGKALQADPDDSLAHQYLAIIYRYQNNNVMADFHDKQAKSILQRREDYARQFNGNPGQFYMERGEFDKAIERFRYEIDHPDKHISNTARADIHWKLAMAWLHLPPDKNGATFTLDARTLQSCRHIPEVIAELEKTLQDNPDYYWAHAALAFIYRYQGNSQMADFHDKKVNDILQKQGAAP